MAPAFRTALSLAFAVFGPAPMADHSLRQPASPSRHLCHRSQWCAPLSTLRSKVGSSSSWRSAHSTTSSLGECHFPPVRSARRSTTADILSGIRFLCQPEHCFSDDLPASMLVNLVGAVWIDGTSPTAPQHRAVSRFYLIDPESQFFRPQSQHAVWYALHFSVSISTDFSSQIGMI